MRETPTQQFQQAMVEYTTQFLHKCGAHTSLLHIASEPMILVQPGKLRRRGQPRQYCRLLFADNRLTVLRHGTNRCFRFRWEDPTIFQELEQFLTELVIQCQQH